MQLKNTATSNIRPYITFVDVELPQDGQHAKREHAAWPQQQASLKFVKSNEIKKKNVKFFRKWLVIYTHLTSSTQRQQSTHF